MAPTDYSMVSNYSAVLVYIIMNPDKYKKGIDKSKRLKNILNIAKASF